MKKFAKVISLMLAAALCMAFAACGKKAESPTNTGSTASGKEKLVMATNATFPPYEYKEGNGYAGIDVEIAGLIAEKLNRELVIEDVEFGSIVSGVQSGKYDMGMAGMTVNDERKKSVDFTKSYATGIQVVIVPENSPYKSFEDFYTGFDDKDQPTGVKDGIKIGVQQDTTGDNYSSADPKDFGFGKENVIRYKNGADAVQALKSNKVTAVIIDNEPAKSFVASTSGLKILEGEYTNEDYAIAVAKNNTELLNNINTALDELTAEGKIKEILDRYIK